MLYSIVLKTKFQTPCTLYPKDVHGWIYQNLEHSCLAKTFHEQRKKCFSIQMLTLNKISTTHEIRISVLYDELANHLVSSIQKMQNTRIGFHELTEVQICLHPSQHPLSCVKVWTELQEGYTDSNRVYIHFVTPTTFHYMGNDVPVPIPELIVNTAIQNWNMLEGLPKVNTLDAAISSEIALSNYDVKLKKYYLDKNKKIYLRGFVGKVEMEIPQKIHVKVRGNIYSAFQLLFYTGLGYKSGFGAGQANDIQCVKDRKVETLAN